MTLESVTFPTRESCRDIFFFRFISPSSEGVFNLRNSFDDPILFLYSDGRSVEWKPKDSQLNV